MAEKLFSSFLMARLSLNTTLYVFEWWPFYDKVNYIALIIEIFQFIWVMIIFVKWKARWLVPVLALQIFPFTGHLAVALGLPGMQLAYWSLVEIPVLLQLLVLTASVVFDDQSRRLG